MGYGVASPGRETNAETSAPNPICFICPSFSILCPFNIQFPALLSKDSQPFSWDLQIGGYFEVVCMLGRPQHFLPALSSMGRS